MNSKERQNLAYLFSFSIHVILLLIFFFINFNVEFDTDEYVTVGFGAIGRQSSSGAIGKEKAFEKNVAEVEKQKEETVKEEKKVEVPKTKNTDTENRIVSADKEKEQEKAPPQEVKPVKEAESDNTGKEFEGEGEGKFGFEIDFGGKGQRKIYSYELPSYPEGVSKEIDVKLRFTILPDGTVGRIFPLIKADARLENAAINSLRQWRFEPLSKNQKQIEQTAVIIFPYRLQ